nr:MAG TPA: hypothetical protein [Caudoviricetes sp.]
MVFLLHLILKIPKYLLFSDKKISLTKKNRRYRSDTDIIISVSAYTLSVRSIYASLSLILPSSSISNSSNISNISVVNILIFLLLN